jgi:hypothetical protein
MMKKRILMVMLIWKWQEKSIQTNVVDDLYVKCCLWWSILTYGILSVPMFLSYECHYQTCSDDGDESSSRKKRSISALFHIYTHRDTRSDVNVTENKRSTWLSLSSTSITFPLAIVVVRGLTNCIDINLMVATCRHSGINYHTCARLLSTSLFIENNEEIPRGEEEEEEKQSVQIPFLKLTRMR